MDYWVKIILLSSILGGTFSVNQSLGRVEAELVAAREARKNISQCTMVNENDVWYLSKGTGVCL